MESKDQITGGQERESSTQDTQIIIRAVEDVDELTEVSAYKQMKFIQLQPGRFSTNFLGVTLGDVSIMRVQVGQSLHSYGSKLADSLLFLIMLEMPECSIYSCNLAISPEYSLFGFNTQRNDFVCQGACVFAQITIKTETFWRYAHQLQRDDLDERYLSSNHVFLAPEQSQELREYLQGLFWILETMPARFRKPRIVTLILEDFIPLLICGIPIRSKNALSIKRSRRHLLLTKAKQIILDHLEKPLTLKQLAQGLKSSSSALSYGFQDAFGISPMRYLKVQRLHAVRRCLKASDPTIHNIQAFAHQFGFWSAGHFARDYKAMFGELPSETLSETT